ncbi:uncharacterized protein LOC117642899 [Thrips palmi]|uniref:Uncharacterized protein LOC117642899 n=1 Tax=Thrips palmi TaxID=161013 RepID=A0A6P8YKX9_THRPL|nr:uncharacterized protein LOC117642899 [Thrips palmi]
MSFLKAGNLNFIRSRPFPTLWSTGYYSVLAFKKFIQQEIHPIKISVSALILIGLVSSTPLLHVMSVYNFLKSKVSEHATKKSPDALERGKMYEMEEPSTL